jgi:hypothetical protein
MRKSNKTLNLLVILLVAFAPWQMAFGTDLDISGFLDVTTSYQNSNDDKSEFGLGQAELDIRSKISPIARVAVDIAYNNDEKVFELSTAEIGLSLYSNENNSISSVDLTAGQFYVPFGIAHNWYPSINNKLVTTPLAVVMTHDGWNDFGAMFNVTANSANFVFFVVNGFESSFEVIDNAQSLATGVAIGEEFNTTPTQAFGSRIGLIPTANLEIGGSIAMGLNESNEDEMIMFGADAQFSYQNLNFEGEYISHSLNRSLAEETNTGYYVQGTYNFERVFFVGRYGSIEPEGMDTYTRYSLGVGYGVTEGVEVRFESTINDNSDNNTNILQLVAGF